MVVVLPAPFGPRKPKISPRRTSKRDARTASTLPSREGLAERLRELVDRQIERRHRRTVGPASPRRAGRSSRSRAGPACVARRAAGHRARVLVELVLDLARADTPRMVAAFEVEPRTPRASAGSRSARGRRSSMPGMGGSASCWLAGVERARAGGAPRSAARRRARRRARSRSRARARCRASRSVASAASASLGEALDALAVLLARSGARKKLASWADVSRALAQRRELERDDVEPVVEVLAERALRDALPCRSRLVAATMRTSTLSVSLPPTRSNVRSCRTRRSLTCVASGISPISSRKSVPPSACSKRPSRRATRAGERALLVAEELALEERLGERGAVEAHERRLRARAARAWSISAMSSLPVPLSPDDEHARLARGDLLDELAAASRIFGSSLTIVAERVALAEPLAERAASPGAARACSIARSTTAESTSKSSGFVR